jgi:hypothetical protein
MKPRHVSCAVVVVGFAALAFVSPFFGALGCVSCFIFGRIYQLDVDIERCP